MEQSAIFCYYLLRPQTTWAMGHFTQIKEGRRTLSVNDVGVWIEGLILLTTVWVYNTPNS